MRNQTQVMHQERVVDHKDRVAVKATKVITQKKQINIFAQWFNVIKAWRSLRKNGEELNKRLTEWRARWSLRHWKNRKQATDKMRRKNNKAIEWHKDLVLRKGFYGINDIGKGETYLAKVLARIDNNQSHLDLYKAFHRIDRNSRANQVSKEKQKSHGESLILMSLKKLFKQQKADAFHDLRSLALEQGGQRLKVRKMMLQCMHRNLRNAFIKWMKQNVNYKMA